MSFRGDERAVSTVVGAVLIFAILILALGTYQSQIVPAQNERVEYEHSQTVGNQLQDLRNALVGTAATGNPRPASVTLGMRYPRRTFTVNPPPPDGVLQGVEFENRSNVTIANVQATNPETADYLDGTLNFSTDGIEYVPDYNELRNAPTTRYEHGTLYDAYENGDISRTGGIVVEDGVITLVTLNVSEEFKKSGTDSVSVDPQALSAPYRSTQIENSSGNITLTLPTKANASMWQEVYEDRGGVSVTPNGSAVDITLSNGSYELRMAHLGVGREMERPGAEYLTLVRGNGTDEVTVEVRDRYNNPVSGVDVTTTSGSFQESTVESESDGEATFVYTGDVEQSVMFSIDGGGTDKTEVTATVGAAGSGTGGGTGGNINPNAPDAVVLQGEVFDGNAVQVNLNNTGNETRNVSSVRYNFYSEETQGGSATNPPQYVVINGETLELRGPYTNIGNLSLSPGANSVAMCFYNDQAATDQYTIGSGDFYILSVQYEDGTAATYFVGPGSGTVTESCGGGGGTENPSAFQFDNFQGFTADADADEFTLDQISVQDADNDDDLDRIEYEVTDSAGNTVATSTVNNIGPAQYQPGGSPAVTLTGDPVVEGETYTLTATVYDADGNYATNQLTDTTPDGSTPPADTTAPTLEQFIVSDESECSNVASGSNNCKGSASTNIAQFSADWEVTDTGGSDLSTVVLRLRDSTGTAVDSASPTVSGNTASGTTTLSHDGGWNNEYTVEIEIADGAGNTETGSVTDTADGSGGGGAGEDPGFAYEDVDGDGSYDSSIDNPIQNFEQTLTNNGGQYDAGTNALVVPSSVGSVTTSNIDLRGEGVTVRTDLEATGSSVSIDAKGGDIAITDATVDNTNAGARQFDFDADGDINIISATLNVGGQTNIESGGDINITGSSIESPNYQQIQMSAGQIFIGTGTSTIVRTAGTISLTAGTTMDLSSAVVETTGNGQEMTLNSNGDMTLVETDIIGVGYPQIRANLGGSYTLDVTDARIVDEGTPSLTYSPSSVSVVGTPSEGTVAAN